jgi:predicted tellurium resistance membrane protein TerC
MEFLMDPTVWIGLLTLTLLEIILGIDNLIFIAILVDKVPTAQRDRARQLGMCLALLMRLFLLAAIFFLTTLTTPLFTLRGTEISFHNLILFVGGLFLLLKATMEIHERLEEKPKERHPARRAGFGSAIAQIIALDVVFSIDSILTAVGMTDRLEVMMAAVVVAMALMIVASGVLTEFINARPPLIILCLGFLLMIGFSLITESFGYHIPKGYLYAAIGFAVMIEAFNQIGLRKRERQITKVPRRQSVADAMPGLLAGVPSTAITARDADIDPIFTERGQQEVFAPIENEVSRGVLGLVDRPVTSIMTPGCALAWIDLDDSEKTLLAEIRSSRHRQLFVRRGSIDKLVGVVRKQDLFDIYMEGKPLNILSIIHAPLVVYEATSILKTLELFKLAAVRIAIVVGEHGNLLGMSRKQTYWKRLQAICRTPSSSVKSADARMGSCCPTVQYRNAVAFNFYIVSVLLEAIALLRGVRFVRAG